MKTHGFTLVEILIVISIIGLIFSVTLPISYELYESYKNSLKAQKVMLYIASLKRESFLYSEEKDISSSEGILIVNGEPKVFPGVYIVVKKPFKLFKNGTSNGGEIEIYVGGEKYKIVVSAPFGDLSLERIRNEKA
ncbi:MAG: prepilin-type cleavage/methylation domain-containing protein [Thermodesulfobacteriota bacterium]|nr:MAG: prepilin-type cleavage/methylation domain-containing protein [Thermodesulfobacteriota bacterium]